MLRKLKAIGNRESKGKLAPKWDIQVRLLNKVFFMLGSCSPSREHIYKIRCQDFIEENIEVHMYCSRLIEEVYVGHNNEDLVLNCLS